MVRGLTKLYSWNLLNWKRYEQAHTNQEALSGKPVVVKFRGLYVLPGSSLIVRHDGVYPPVPHLPSVQLRRYEDTWQTLYRLEIGKRLHSAENKWHLQLNSFVCTIIK